MIVSASLHFLTELNTELSIFSENSVELFTIYGYSEQIALAEFVSDMGDGMLKRVLTGTQHG